MILTIASFKGGVGKSVTALHLARFLSDYGKTVLADGDLNCSVSNWATRGNPPFVVCDRESIETVGDFENLVIDTQARPDTDDLLALAEASDILLMPTSCTAFAIEAMVLTVGVLDQIPSEKLKIVLTIVPPKPSKAGEKAKNALIECNLPVCNQWIRRYGCYPKAEEQGVTVAELKGDRNTSNAWADYKSLGKELLNHA